MRSYGMYDATRGLTLAVAAGIVGLALWGAAQIGTYTAGRFWVVMVVIAFAGCLLGLASHVGNWTKRLRLRLSPGTFVLAFVPVLVCVGWILLASQPGTGWEEGRIDSWSRSMGILGAVHAIALWHGVLAFGFGIVLALSFDAVPEEIVEDAAVYGAPAHAAAPPVAGEPVGAGRSWGGRERPVREGDGSRD